MSSCSAWPCRVAFLCWFLLRCANWCSAVPWCVSWFCAVLFVSLRCLDRVVPLPCCVRWLCSVCPWAWCCVVLLCCPWSGCCLSLCSVFGRFPLRGASCLVLCWCACVVPPCAVLSHATGTGCRCVLLPVVLGCLLLGLAVLCCLLVASGVVFRWCCPCPVAWLAALWFDVVCIGAPLPCVVFCGAVLSCGGVLSCCADCLRRCLWLFFFAAAALSAVCVPGCRAVRFLSSPLCAVLCCAMLVPLQCVSSCGPRCFWHLVLCSVAVCCGVSFGVLLCGARSGRPRLSSGGVIWCQCPCLAAWPASLCLVGLLCRPAPLCCVLWCCAVVWWCAVVFWCRFAVLCVLALAFLL